MTDPNPGRRAVNRDFWLDEIVREQRRTIIYAETVLLAVEVDDIGGIRRALEREIAHMKLSIAAAKKIEGFEAEGKAAVKALAGKASA